MSLPIIDSHLDLAWCALSFNRDLILSVDEIRVREKGMTDEPSRAKNVLTLPELRESGVGVCVGTLLARGGPEQAFKEMYKRTDLDFSSQSIAYGQAHGQLAYYHLLQKQGHIRMIRSARDLDAHWAAWQNNPRAEPMGMILSMEGADPIVEPKQAEEWWENGLRAVGPAHYGRSHYAYGTGVSGPLSAKGVELLKVFSRLGMILDVTHLCDESMKQAFDLFHGPMLASHHNCRALVPGDRQLTDEQIKILIGRGAVIGAALDAWMLYPNWIRGKTQPEVISLEAVADHIDHISQLAGSAKHSAIGSDLDGGFGFEQTPRDLNKYRDLQKLAGILKARGYDQNAIEGVFWGNWLAFFKKHLPAG